MSGVWPQLGRTAVVRCAEAAGSAWKLGRLCWLCERRPAARFGAGLAMQEVREADAPDLRPRCAAEMDGGKMCRWCGMLCDGDAEVAWCAEVARPWRSWAGFVRRAGLLCAKHGRCWSGGLLCWRSGCAEAGDPGGRREEADAEAMRPIKGPKVQGHRDFSEQRVMEFGILARRELSGSMVQRFQRGWSLVFFVVGRWIRSSVAVGVARIDCSFLAFRGSAHTDLCKDSGQRKCTVNNVTRFRASGCRVEEWPSGHVL
ncbi:hypothetical protein Taro_036435 [Colocasia esculenta]|uniref:Uncharacterized protein n=1 Tax=Colocasia esculenta TaxID=4460 RepID=A0A843VXH8_COLES|nr:hypothetical protein [Colocasia esculenta]